MTWLKALVLALLLANIAYFLWLRDIVGPAQPGSVLSGPGLKLAAEAPVRAHSPVAPAPVAQTRSCLSVGPFRDMAEATRAATTLRSAGHEPRQRAGQGEVPAGIWVYVARPEDPLASDQLLSRLRQAGVDDALVMPGPDEMPVISLGLFNDPGRARTRFEQAQALGLKPVQVDRMRSTDVFWVDVDMKAPGETLDTTGLQSGSSRIMRLEVRNCPGP